METESYAHEREVGRPRSLLSNGVWWWGVGGVVLGFSGGLG